MALLSDVDWTIILVVAAFLLFGPQNAEHLRTLGRWYGRAMRLKQDLLSEFARATDLPAPGNGLSIRGALLGGDEPAALRGVPAAVARPPPAMEARATTLTMPTSPPWTGGYPVATWTPTVPAVPFENEVGR